MKRRASAHTHIHTQTHVLFHADFCCKLVSITAVCLAAGDKDLSLSVSHRRTQAHAHISCYTHNEHTSVSVEVKAMLTLLWIILKASQDSFGFSFFLKERCGEMTSVELGWVKTSMLQTFTVSWTGSRTKCSIQSRNTKSASALYLLFYSLLNKTAAWIVAIYSLKNGRKANFTSFKM